MFQCKKLYVCALVGVLIKCFYEMHGATIEKEKTSYLENLYTCCVRIYLSLSLTSQELMTLLYV